MLSLKIQTKDITMAGLLVALTVILGTTGIGFLPVPTPAGAATLMHIPVILAGLVSTPLVASFVGLIFGLFCFKFMGDLRVVIPARLLVGVVSWLVYRPWRGWESSISLRRSSRISAALRPSRAVRGAALSFTPGALSRRAAGTPDLQAPAYG